jgi:hypothetical protein
MEKPEPDAKGQILAIDDPEMRALQWRQSGYPLFDEPNPRLISGDGENAAINRAIVGDR